MSKWGDERLLRRINAHLPRKRAQREKTILVCNKNSISRNLPRPGHQPSTAAISRLVALTRRDIRRGSEPDMIPRIFLAHGQIRHRRKGIAIQKTRSSRRADHRAFQVGTDIRKINRRALRFFAFGCPLLNRAVNLLKIIDAGAFVRCVSRAQKRGNCHSGEQADQRHHDHDLDQSKPNASRRDLSPRAISGGNQCA